MSKVEREKGLSAISRRAFVAGSALAGAAALTGFRFRLPGGRGERPDLATAHGPDVVRNTKAVIEAMGGMSAYVSAGDVVNILPNAQGSHPGTSTNPELVRTVVGACKEAGAKEVRWLTWLPERVWQRNNLSALVEGSGTTLIAVDLEDAEQWKEVEVPRGVALKKIRVYKALWECDVFISMPIIKDHVGSRFTGVLKNYMGASHGTDNRLFHPTFEGENLAHMEQCIADLNTAVREPDLIIGDAMTVLATNGPFGPGELKKPERVFAGVDRVAFDSYGATLIGLSGPEVTMIKNAHDLGLGEIDLAKLQIEEIEVA